MDSQAASAVKLIVGNKCDLEESRSVPRNQAHKLAEEIGCRYLECSAMTGQNVEEAFNSTIHSILIKKGLLPTASPSPSDPPLLDRRGSLVNLKEGEEKREEKKEGGCC
jgi:GTPase SAR1 family protein